MADPSILFMLRDDRGRLPTVDLYRLDEGQLDANRAPRQAFTLAASGVPARGCEMPPIDQQALGGDAARDLARKFYKFEFADRPPCRRGWKIVEPADPATGAPEQAYRVSDVADNYGRQTLLWTVYAVKVES